MRIPGAALAMVCAFACASAYAGDFKRVGPLAPASGLVASRPTAEPAFEFSYRIETGAEAATLTFDLAPKMSLMTRDRGIVIFDYALKRLIDLDDAAHKFRNDSWYGVVDGWVRETASRRAQHGDVFRTQSELHIVDAQDGTPAIGNRADADGTLRFTHAGAEVASVKFSDHKLNADEAVRFKRFLVSYSSLHPAIVAAIAGRATLPERLSFTVQTDGKTAASVWTLQSFAQVKAVNPLESGAHPPDQTGRPELAAGLLGVIGAALGGEAPGKHSAAEFETLIGKALAAHRPFQAVLLALERDGQHPGKCARHCHATKALAAASAKDPRMAALRAALVPAKDKLDAAITALKAMKRDDLSNAYMLDDYLANLLVKAGRGAEALPLLAGALRADPYMASFYHDMGNAYRAGGDSITAWMFYDLGRALPEGTQTFTDIGAYEDAMAKKYPELF